jgi:outer membrane protein assembly factor BamD (BamD/ComL family)
MAVTVWCSHSDGTTQRRRWDDDGFAYRRWIELPADVESPAAVAVCEFFTHGAMNDSAAFAVYGDRKLAASRLLQRGPGDFCRIAFQTINGQQRYWLYYGGKAENTDEQPNWTVRAGLLFETRRWKTCDLNSLDSVRDALEASQRIGVDLVPQVFHRHNPFDTKVAPFLSRYGGYLQAPSSGKYAFFTSSQDASFLLIDGKQVVAAPGVHGPARTAKVRGEVELDEGPHRFEYYHAASREAACMVAAWQIPGMERPSAIPPTAFGYERVARPVPMRLDHRDEGPQPDFRAIILGDLPTPEGDSAMVRVQFLNATASALTTNALYDWQFGDGQTSFRAQPGHVYLRPGEYTVSLRVTRGTRVLETSSRVYITRQFMVEAKQASQEEQLANYLEVLEQYNAASLGAQELVQLVRAYILAEETQKAVETAKIAFHPDALNHTDESRWEIIKRVGPVARIQRADTETAAALHVAATQLIRRPAWRFACGIEAADITLNELLAPAQAKMLLDEIANDFGDATSLEQSKYHRVVGDWYARTGNAEEAREAYHKAAAARELKYSQLQRIAWQGAHSRSTEAYLRAGELQRARGELDRWQRDFPTDKIDGYLPFLLARCWRESEQPLRALAVAADSLVVNPNSPYADRLVYLSAECEEALNRPARAAAVYRTLFVDYPGSPLVPKAKERIQALQEEAAKKAAATKKSAKPRKP